MMIGVGSFTTPGIRDRVGRDKPYSEAHRHVGSVDRRNARSRSHAMDPITWAIDKTEEVLGHSPHPAIVAVPLGAWAVSNLCDVLGLLTGEERYDDIARLSMAVGLVGAAGAVLTGLHDYGYIPADRQPSHEVATTHGLGNGVVCSLFVTSYILRTRDHAAGYRTGRSARLLGLAGGALSLYTAWLGGKLVEEYGEAVKPIIARQKAEHDRHEDDARRGRERLGPNPGRPARREP
jgi:uncharacterized membrane protein